MRDLTGGYAGALSRSHSLARNAFAYSQSHASRYEAMNRNAGISHDGRRDWTNVNVGQLSGQTNELPQAARDVWQRTGQRLKSPGPEAAPIAHECTPDPDRTQAARNAPAHRGPFRGLFPEPMPVDPPSRTPTSIGFSTARPEPALNFKCFLFTSGREVISPCFSFGTAHMRTSLQNSISCTPPRQREKHRMPEDPKGLSTLITLTGSFRPPSCCPHSLAAAAKTPMT